MEAPQTVTNPRGTADLSDSRNPQHDPSGGEPWERDMTGKQMAFRKWASWALKRDVAPELAGVGASRLSERWAVGIIRNNYERASWN